MESYQIISSYISFIELLIPIIQKETDNRTYRVLRTVDNKKRIETVQKTIESRSITDSRRILRTIKSNF